MQRTGRVVIRPVLVLALAWICAGCHGQGPLLHPAHVLHPGDVSLGAGVFGAMVVAGAQADSPGAGSRGAPDGVVERTLSELTVAPGMAPWASARVGIEGENEAGLTYTGRALRLDGRHAFSLGKPTLSIGLGAAALFAEANDASGDGGGVYGGGVDVPILLGFRSDADIYALWFGPRVGIELLSGEVRLPDPDRSRTAPLVDASGLHLQLGLVLGVRAGFRHVHVALEAGVTYHHAEGDLGGTSVAIDQATFAPGGALTATF